MNFIPKTTSHDVDMAVLLHQQKLEHYIKNMEKLEKKKRIKNMKHHLFQTKI